MKKALTRTLLAALSILILAGIIPLSANASTSSNKTKIFSYLTSELGFNSAAACGIMANIEKESMFKSNVIIKDSNGLPSGGLCMWNGGRLKNLKNFCSEKGLDYLSIEGQLSYLKEELQKSYYSHIYKYLKNVADNSSGAYNAAYYWCYYFEIPANRGSKSVQRGNSAISNYWPVYGAKDIKKPTVKFKTGESSYTVGSNVTVTWNNAGKDVDGYKVYLVEKDQKTGKYDYENSKIFFFDENAKSCTIKEKYLAIGQYKVYVYAYNSTTGDSKGSNVLSLKIRCKLHDYESKITKYPTAKANGVTTYTCTACGKVKEKALTLKSYFGDNQVANFRVTGIAKNAIKVRWNEFKGADGYKVYVKQGDKFVDIGTVSSKDDLALMVKGLDSATTYSFKVYAFKETDEGKVFSDVSKTIKATTKAAA